MLGECVVKIKDITEGLYDTLAGAGQFIKRATHKAGPSAETHAFNRAVARVPSPAPTTPTTPSKPETTQISNPQEGSVLLVKAANGEYYFKSYNGTWHLKGKAPDDFSVGGTKIANPADVTALDALLPKAQLVGIKPVPNEPPTAWVYDQRKTALLNKRRGVK